MINYPNQLNTLFQTLIQHNLKPIIVGGFVRDSLLCIDSKDIDVEVYNLDSYDTLEKILQPFGDVNSVGKSFGVCKLKYKNLEIDFSLPRQDTNIGLGHKEFKIETYSHIDFTTASSRRDFSINAIGYDITSKKLLDPFNGVQDLQNRYLKAVNLEKFAQDPLRVLRAMQFSARFKLKIDKELFTLCETMIQDEILDTLPKERVFLEFQKLFTKAQKASIGIDFFEKIGGMKYLGITQTEVEKHTIYKALDNVKIPNLEISIVILTFSLNTIELTLFLSKLTNDKKLIKNIITLHNHKNIFQSYSHLSDYELYKLATKVELKKVLSLHQAYFGDTYETLIQHIDKLSILHQPLKQLLQGKELIKLGQKPSPKFATILQEAYDAQMKGIFNNYETGMVWLKDFLHNLD